MDLDFDRQLYKGHSESDTSSEQCPDGQIASYVPGVPAQGNTDLLSCSSMMGVEKLSVTFGHMRQLW